MKILIYTRPPDHGSSITTRHWSSAVRRTGMESLEHEIVLCHSDEDLTRHLDDTDVVVSSKADLRNVVSPDHASVKLIFFAFAGVDHLVPFDWVPDGAYVVNNSGASGYAIGEYAIFALQLLANGIVRPGSSAFVGSASQSGFSSLAGRSATIVGTGGVGGAVAAMCRAFRMNVQGVSRSGRPDRRFDAVHPSSRLEAAIGQSDFVVIACPVTAETRDLFDRPMIARMKPGGYLVNVARGSIVDEEAVCDAVDSGAVGGAVLDVVRASASDADARVRNTPGILVTPHVSGDDERHFIDNSLDIFMVNLREFLEGKKPRNAVDFGLGY